MNKKERVLTALRGGEVDQIPWTMYKSYPPWGEKELEFRNDGLCLVYQHFPICLSENSEVEVTESSSIELKPSGSETGASMDGSTRSSTDGRNRINRSFRTRIGEVTTTHELPANSIPSPGDLIQLFGSGIDQEILSWVTSYPFQGERDYETLEYIFRNIEFHLNNDEFLKTERLIGNEGVVFAMMGKSPFQIILYELMGVERCFLEFVDHPQKFRRLYEVLYQKQKEKFLLASESDALLYWMPENLTSVLTPPAYFEEFYVPFYNEMADILHRKNKLLIVHMDGMIRSLVDLIRKTRIDIIEAFTPPPMGDLPVRDAISRLDKVIWVNFPGSVLAWPNARKVEEYTIKMIQDAAPGRRFLIGCTESYPMDTWEQSFGAVRDAIKKVGRFPVSGTIQG